MVHLFRSLFRSLVGSFFCFHFLSQYLPNTLALTPFPMWIGSICGMGLFLEQGDDSSPITHRDILTFGRGCGGPYLSGRHSQKYISFPQIAVPQDVLLAAFATPMGFMIRRVSEPASSFHPLSLVARPPPHFFYNSWYDLNPAQHPMGERFCASCKC